MSKMTTRIDKDTIIQKAKQRYEDEQQSKLPTEIVKLPSGGNVYPATSPLRSGQVEIRYMTAYDEDILTNVSYVREGVMFSKLLESVIMSDCNVDDIISADQDAILIQSRILSNSSDYPLQVTDPNTWKQLSRSVNLSKLKYKSFKLNPDENGEFIYKIKNDKETTMKFSYDINVNTN